MTPMRLINNKQQQTTTTSYTIYIKVFLFNSIRVVRSYCCDATQQGEHTLQ
jgi:hypothetical protein